MIEPRKVLKLVPGKKTEAETGPFPIGAKVRLKSGGPFLCVQKPGPEWSYCTWFDDVGNRMGPEEFRNGTLELYAERKPRVRVIKRRTSK